MNLYNEIDPKAAAWLRELIRDGHIPPGVVDERSICDITPDELTRYTQCHFFAGIGGRSLALRLAGWPDDRHVWTGSCPCQPFSAAGQGGGFDDERHLWPHWHYLIQQCGPAVVFGEQVASKDGLSWFDLVHADLEATGYAVGAADMCAAGVGAPHIRQRLWIVADAGSTGLPARECASVVGTRWWEEGRTVEQCDGAPVGGVGHTERLGTGRDAGTGVGAQSGLELRAVGDDVGSPSAVGGPRPSHVDWGTADWLYCRDGKWRPVEPGSFPLAHGVPARVAALRGYGNAIVPPLAAEFIQAYLDVTNSVR